MIAMILVLFILAVSGVVEASVPIKIKHHKPTVLEALSKPATKGVTELDLSLYDVSTISKIIDSKCSIYGKIRRSQSLYNVRYSISNFSTITVISLLEFRWSAVPNLQWIGNPPNHVS